MKIIDSKELKAIIDAARQGDSDAFATLYSAFYQKVYFSAFKILGNETEAEDVTQDVFMSVYKNIKNLRKSTNFVSWLDRIIYTTCLTSISHRMDNLPEEELLNLEDFDEDRTPGEIYMKGETSRLISEAIDRLSEDHREVIVMKYYMGIKIKDIAEALEISEGTVKSRLKYGRDYLNKFLKKHRAKGLLVTMPIAEALQAEAAALSFDSLQASSILQKITGDAIPFQELYVKSAPQFGATGIGIAGIALAFVVSLGYGMVLPSEPSIAASPPVVQYDTTAPQIVTSTFNNYQAILTFSDNESGMDESAFKLESSDGKTLAPISYNTSTGILILPYSDTAYTLYYADKSGNTGHMLIYPENKKIRP